MEMWMGDENITLLFSLKGFEILHQEKRGQMNLHSNGTLQEHSQLRECKHAAYLLINP
jgi:hypothetical protein